MEVRPWETQEGEKRQSVERIADEIGPSVRWATVDIAKSDRRGPSEGGGGGGGSRQPVGAPSESFDEEPF
jgi:single-strand DNA-binding protein